MDILSRIQDLQKARGWSNYALAKKASLPKNSINNILSYFPPDGSCEEKGEMCIITVNNKKTGGCEWTT